MNNSTLFIGNSPMDSNSNNGKTLESLFSSLKVSLISQLYFNHDLPNSQFVNKFYRISEIDLMLNKEGPISNYSNALKTSRLLSSIVRIFKNRFFAFSKDYLRELIRLVIPFSRIKLTKWIKEIRPNIIILQLGKSVFAIVLTIFISKISDSKIFLFIGDDYFFNTKRKKIKGFVSLYLLRYYKKIFKISHGYFCASDMMLDKYKAFFGGNGHCILTPFNDINYPRPQFIDGNYYDFTYVGSLGLGRYKSLLEFSKVLLKFDKKINVFTNEKRKFILKKLLNNKGVVFHGFKDATEISKIIINSKVLLHFESFNIKFIRMVKYSMSTKIPEYLNSGNLILCYGPMEVSSIIYLKTNFSAIIASNMSELERKLKLVFSNSYDKSIVKNAKILFMKRHNPHLNSQLVYNIIFN